MTRSQEIRDLVYKGVSQPDSRFFYKSHWLVYNNVPVCRVYEKYAIYSMDMYRPYALEDMAAYSEGLDVPVYPFPPSIFKYIEGAVIGGEISGVYWIDYLQKLCDTARGGSKNSLDILKKILEGYYAFYTVQKIKPPKNSQDFIRAIKLSEIEKKCLSTRTEREIEIIFVALPKWRLDTGSPRMRNKTGREYLRYNTENFFVETTMGAQINQDEFLAAVEKYESGEKLIKMEAITSEKDENGKTHITDLSIPINVLDNGDVSVNCVIIKKEEFLNAARDVKAKQDIQHSAQVGHNQ